ncbi:OmpA family protein [Flammeovirga aprica]|uniref:OmpA family protein n=1 Tax=Flammeovirga aprica JL-4 TaxID=694437 RepID=A0A7X9RUA3_9BACT|nr:OmpA family protein [Flammeovirga aprica]NME68837.1 OmpA family protein [Flammeovirga aprica JL-4]
MKLTIVLTILLQLLTQTIVFAQSSHDSKYMKKANEYFERSDYVLAIDYFEKVNKLDIISEYKLAYAYQHTLQYHEAVRVYEKLVNFNWELSDEVLLNYGLMLKSLEQYSKAGKAFQKYLYKNPRDHEVRDLYLSCQASQLKKLKKNKFNVIIEGLSFNAKEKDFSPLIFDGGIAFCSSRPLKKRQNIHNRDGYSFINLVKVSKTNLGAYTDVELLDKDIFSNHHVGPSYFDKSSNMMYVTINVDKNEVIDGENFDIHHLEIRTTKYKDGEFQRMADFELNNKDFSVGHPTLTKDGNTIYFISDMADGKGGTDIYVSHRNISGGWDSPYNIGEMINTSGNEVFPFIYNDSTLFFSSDRHIGLGGLDIYKANIRNNRVVSVENMGYPFNSSKDDFGMAIDHDIEEFKGYFSSNRDGGTGADDVYHFREVPDNVTVLVVDSLTKEPLANSSVILFDCEEEPISEGTTDDKGTFSTSVDLHNFCKVEAIQMGYIPKIVNTKYLQKEFGGVFVIVDLVKGQQIRMEGFIIDEDTKEKIPQASIALEDSKYVHLDQTSSSQYGHYQFIFGEKAPDQKMNLKVSAQGYLAKDANVDAANISMDGVIRRDVYLKRMIKNDLLEIENIYYPFDKAYLTPEAKVILNDLYRIMVNNPSLIVEMGSHCDIRGSDDYNIDLSRRRAESVISYMSARGINTRRLIYQFYGEKVNAVDCISCTETQHQLNRRTEFKILDY